MKSEISTTTSDAVESHPSSSMIHPSSHDPALPNSRIESLLSITSFQQRSNNTAPEKVRPRRNPYVNMSVKTNNFRKISKFDSLNERVLSSVFSSKKK